MFMLMVLAIVSGVLYRSYRVTKDKDNGFDKWVGTMCSAGCHAT